MKLSLALALLIGTVLDAAAGDPALPVAAQRAYDNGIEAAKHKEFGVAARHFAEAQMHAPTAPSVLFNLGLAQAQAGRELIGMAWLKAYLASSPNAPNAAAIADEIEKLRSAARTRIESVYQEITSSSQKLDAEHAPVALGHVAWSHAHSGHIEAAMATKKLAGDSDFSFLWEVYALKMAQRGESEKAIKAAGHTKDPFGVWELVSKDKLQRNDFEGARNLIVQMTTNQYTRERVFKIVHDATLQHLLMANVKRGDFTTAPLDELLANNNESVVWNRVGTVIWLAEQQVQAKEIAGAEISYARAIQMTNSIPFWEASLLLQVAESQFRIGRLADARNTARMIVATGPPAATNQFRDAKLETLSAAHAILGNYKEATRIAQELRDHPFNRWPADTAFSKIVFYQANDSLPAAKKTSMLATGLLKTREERTKLGDIQNFGSKQKYMESAGLTEAALADAQIKKGDFSGALKTLGSSKVKMHGYVRSVAAIVDERLRKNKVQDALSAAQTMLKADVEALKGWGDKAWFDWMVSNSLEKVLRAQANTGNTTAAEQTLAIVSHSNPYRRNVISALAETREKAGDTASAHQLRKQIPRDDWIAIALEISDLEAASNLEGWIKKQTIEKYYDGSPPKAEEIVGRVGGGLFRLRDLLWKVEQVERTLTK